MSLLFVPLPCVSVVMRVSLSCSPPCFMSHASHVLAHCRRFFNHACSSANLDKQTILTVDCGSALLHYVGLYATKEGGIPAGEELVYDYRWTEAHMQAECHCNDCVANTPAAQ